MAGKILAAVLVLIVIGLNVAYSQWDKSLSSNGVPYPVNVDIKKMIPDPDGRLWISGDQGLQVYEDGQLADTFDRNDSPALTTIGNTGFEINGRRGVFWFTNKNVALYDGHAWRTIPVPESPAPDPADFFSSLISAAAIDPGGGVWLGFDGGGLKVFDGTGWEVYTRENSELPVNHIQSIAFDARGRAWIGTSAGLGIFDGEDWQEINQIPNISAIAFDSRGRAWLGSDTSVSMLDGEDLTSFPNESLGVWESEKVQEILVNGNDVVWVWFADDFNIGPDGRVGGNVRVFDGEIWKYVFDVENPAILEMTAGADDSVWFATRSRFAYYPRVINLRLDSPIVMTYDQALLRGAIESGSLLFLTILLLGTALMTVLRVPWLVHALAFAGLAVYIAWIMYRVPPHPPLGMHGLDVFESAFFILNPGALGTIGVFLGGLIGWQAARAGRTGQLTMQGGWAFVGFVFGAVTSLVLVALDAFVRSL